MAKRQKRPTKEEKVTAAVEEHIPQALSFESPESSSIKSATYDPDTETLAVYFSTGNIYDFYSFPSRLWTEFYLSASKGGFFARYIRTMYAGVQRLEKETARV